MLCTKSLWNLTTTLITLGFKAETFNLAKICIDTPFKKGDITACVLDDCLPDYAFYDDVLIGNGGTLDSPISIDPNPNVSKTLEDSHSHFHDN